MLKETAINGKANKIRDSKPKRNTIKVEENTKIQAF